MIMFAQRRHRVIIEAVKARSPLSVPELEQLLQASPATVRRDLRFLENLGKIVRTHEARHDKEKEHGAFGVPGGRPRKKKVS